MRIEISNYLIDRTDNGMVKFYNQYWSAIKGESIFDLSDDLELCCLAVIYGAYEAVGCKEKGRYWIGGYDIPKPVFVENLDEAIDGICDIREVLKNRELCKMLNIQDLCLDYCREFIEKLVSE